MDEISHRPEEYQECIEQAKALKELLAKKCIIESAEETLWKTIIAFQHFPFHTSSGLPFTYAIKRGRNGEYTGELVVSRKEGSKTLTKSSVMLAFQRVMERKSAEGKAAEYTGPKAIGQIFGISYIYSIFWRFGLIRVPEKVEEKLRGNVVKDDREDSAVR